MKNNLNISFFSGLAIGVLSPLVLLPIIVFILSQSYGQSFSYLWHQTLNFQDFLSRYLSLGLIGNLGWFYFFLNREQYFHTRGIIFGMLLYAPYMIYVNLGRFF
ncbi:MAG: hypothetical protein RL511_545 [Bacteroidota bacterium]|jgi:hypothetical protein